MEKNKAIDHLSYKMVWDTLSSVDVSDKVEKKGNLSYLSWAWAWGKLMEYFPQATFEFTEFEYSDGTTGDVQVYPDGSMAVECTIRINSLCRTMWLPVMDYKNNAIPSPNSRQISDNKMRCLVKCIGMFGLGHYIYAGEDLPQDVAQKEVAPKKPTPKKTTKKKADKPLPPVVKGEKKMTQREQDVDTIKKLIDSDAFDEKNKSAILNFVAGITDKTPDSDVNLWANRMKDVVNKFKETK